MARWIPAALVVLALTMTGSAAAEPRPSPFPLDDGNRWTMRDAETSLARTISVNQESGGLVLKGLPGAPSLRVRWVGETVQAWDTADQRWESVFRFGEPAGTSYLVRLGSTLLWRNLTVTVASKRARVDDYEGRTRVCTRFIFASKQKVADAGLESFAFARGIGPIQIVEQSIAGTRELALAGHRLK
jgi:hypothetical protein